MTISKAGRLNNKGFTLLELLIVIVIVAMVMGLVVGQAGKLFRRDMKFQAGKLAATIRYLYNKSVSEGVVLRLVFDLSESKYWVESTEVPFTLTREEEDTKEELQKEEEEDKGSESEEGRKKPKKAVFTPEESALLKSVTLSKGVYIKDIYAEHQMERLSSGRAYIYFFPQGYVESSIINLRDKDDKIHYSLEVNPVTGTVKIDNQYKEPRIER